MQKLHGVELSKMAVLTEILQLHTTQLLDKNVSNLTSIKQISDYYITTHKKTYVNLNKFREIKGKYDPSKLINSFQSQRLG